MMLEGITELTIYEVEELQTLFLKELNGDNSLLIDMKQIEKIDMVGIQLLLSLLKSADEIEKEVKFINISENTLHQIKSCYCEKALGIDNG